MVDGVIPIRKIFKDKVSERDAKYLDPNERAEFVNTFLHIALGLSGPEDFISQPLYWDIVCYSIEIMGAAALGINDEAFLELIKAASKFVYSLHYSVPAGEAHLNVEREEHIKLWEERIAWIEREHGKKD